VPAPSGGRSRPGRRRRPGSSASPRPGSATRPAARPATGRGTCSVRAASKRTSTSSSGPGPLAGRRGWWARWRPGFASSRPAASTRPVSTGPGSGFPACPPPGTRRSARPKTSSCPPTPRVTRRSRTTPPSRPWPRPCWPRTASAAAPAGLACGGQPRPWTPARCSAGSGSGPVMVPRWRTALSWSAGPRTSPFWSAAGRYSPAMSLRAACTCSVSRSPGGSTRLQRAAVSRSSVRASPMRPTWL
jgi:hypothetical protein